ncbi:MAG: hypothetical protein ACK54C_05380, partial [Betaproteobacteria bacterium]
MKALMRVACVGMLLLTGCASVGPPTVSRDRFDYITTISESWKRQMLVNLLKVRYADAPVFMDVTAVISSYSVEGEVSEVIGPSPQIAPKKHCAGGLWQCRIRCRGRP